MAATDRPEAAAARRAPPEAGAKSWSGPAFPRDLLRRLWAVLGSLLGSFLATGGARALDLPADNAEAMFHSYNGGGVSAKGPALLVRKSIADSFSLNASYYVDLVSNASIDVVTTASPYHERRDESSFGADYIYRDSQITVSTSTSKEPDYTANRYGLDISQETFGGMTTVSLGFTRGADDVRKHNEPDFVDHATHWQYRTGLTQILTPRWIASANFEAISDDGYLGSPYRSAIVFGAFVLERNPRTRSSRAMNFRVNGDLGSHDAIHLQYRYFWDTWAIKAHTLELGYSRYFGDRWLADTSLRYYRQGHALFYSDDAQTATTYVSRNRQLSTFDSVGLGAKLAHTVRKVPGRYEVKVNASYEYVRYKYSDFTDIRTHTPYGFNAGVLQVYVSATF